MAMDAGPRVGKFMVTSDLDRWVEEFHDIENIAHEMAYDATEVSYGCDFDSVEDISPSAVEYIREYNGDRADRLLKYRDVYDAEMERLEKIRRNWVAQIDMSEVPKDQYWQVSRGFGNEFFVDDPTNAKSVRVMSIWDAQAYDKQHHAQLPQSKEELLEFYNAVRGGNYELV